MATSVILRDETASTDLISESMDDPVVVYPNAGWEADANNLAIGRRLDNLTKQAELYVLSGTGHTYSIKKNGAIQRSIAPLAAFTQHVLRFYISSVLQSTETFPSGEVNRAPYSQRRAHLVLDCELNPTHSFTDLPT
jgi:hypothetical protein